MEVRVGTQGRNLEARTEARNVEEHHFLAYSLNTFLNTLGQPCHGCHHPQLAERPYIKH